MRAQCGAFAKTKGQRCNNRALPGSTYCILHFEKAPLIIGALIGAVLSLAVSITWNKIVPSDEQRELRELKNEIRPILDIARKTAPNASDKDALVALAREVKDLRRVQRAVTSFETEVEVAVSGNWAANEAPHAYIMVMGDAADEYLDIKLTDGSTKRVPLHVQGGVTISELDANTVVVRYRTQVRPGNWPINEDSRVLRACEGVGVVAWGIKKSYVTDGMIRVQQIEVKVFINGQKKLTIAGTGGGPFSLPGGEGSAKLDFRKHQEFETGS
jgi:hypothetical protein